MIHLSHLWLSKEKQIELYLKAGFSLTVKECVDKFGHWRLPSVVGKMKAKGIPVNKVTEKGKAIYYVKRKELQSN